MNQQHKPDITLTTSPTSPQPRIAPATPSAFPENLPPRRAPTRSFKERTHAGIHPFFRETWYAYSLRHLGSRAKFWRRLAMILTFLIRFVLGALLATFGGYGRGSYITGWVIGGLLSIISFFSYGWCLAAIGEAEGVRKVLKIPFGRKHFDGFIGVSLLGHLALLLAPLAGWFPISWFLTIWWNLLWIAAALYAWVATIKPDPTLSHSAPFGSSYDPQYA